MVAPPCSCMAVPGAGAGAVHRRFFDPSYWRVVLFDQRGAGPVPPAGQHQREHHAGAAARYRSTARPARHSAVAAVRRLLGLDARPVLRPRRKRLDVVLFGQQLARSCQAPGWKGLLTPLLLLVRAGVGAPAGRRGGRRCLAAGGVRAADCGWPFGSASMHFTLVARHLTAAHARSLPPCLSQNADSIAWATCRCALRPCGERHELSDRARGAWSRCSQRPRVVRSLWSHRAGGADGLQGGERLRRASLYLQNTIPLSAIRSVLQYCRPANLPISSCRCMTSYKVMSVT